MQRGPCFRRTTMQVTGNISFIIASQTADEVCGEMPVQSGILNPFGVAPIPGVLAISAVTLAELHFGVLVRSEEHTSELQSLMRISYAVFCLKKKKSHKKHTSTYQ